MREMRGPSSHRHAGLREQLQRAGQAEAWGHGQQPAWVVPVVGPLKEQSRLFFSPVGGKACRRLPHGHLSARTLPRHTFSRAACAQAQSKEHGIAGGGRRDAGVGVILRNSSATKSQASRDPWRVGWGWVMDGRTLGNVPLSPKWFAFTSRRSCLHHIEG